jgi:hypothetical protein
MKGVNGGGGRDGGRGGLKGGSGGGGEPCGGGGRSGGNAGGSGGNKGAGELGGDAGGAGGHGGAGDAGGDDGGAGDVEGGDHGGEGKLGGSGGGVLSLLIGISGVSSLRNLSTYHGKARQRWFASYRVKSGRAGPESKMAERREQSEQRYSTGWQYSPSLQSKFVPHLRRMQAGHE